MGIDCGTDGSGIAYALPDGSSYIHNMWGDTDANKKPKTSVLFDKENNQIGVASGAQDMYLKCKGDQGWKLFERFKMSLYGIVHILFINLFIFYILCDTQRNQQQNLN